MSHLANKGQEHKGHKAEHWFTARQTQPTGSWGQPGKTLRVTAHGHLKSALAWKRTSETKLQSCYGHQVDVVRVNPLVTQQLFCITHWQRCEETPGAETGSRQGSGLWLPGEISPCNSSPNSSSCSNLSPGHGHTWNFGHMNVEEFPGTGWTSHLQQTSGVSCSWGYLNLGVSGRVSRCCAIRQLLTSLQQLFSTIAHVILPIFFSTKRSSSLPGKIFSFPTKHYPKISLWALLIKSKLLILLSAPRSRTSLFF